MLIDPSRTASTAVEGGCSLSTSTGASTSPRRAAPPPPAPTPRRALRRLPRAPCAPRRPPRARRRPSRRPTPWTARPARAARRRCVRSRRGRCRPTPSDRTDVRRRSLSRSSPRRLDSTSGTRSGEVGTTNPTAGPCIAALPWIHAPIAAASNGSIRIASSAPMMPASTSPVPAVARRSSPAFTTSTSPAGSATTVVAPFSSTTVSVLSASLRVAAIRSGPGSAPVSSWYSPSCGVRTVGASRWRSSAAAPCRSTRPRTAPSPSITIGSGVWIATLASAGGRVVDPAEARPEHDGVETVERASASAAHAVAGSGRCTASNGSGRRGRPPASTTAPCRRRVRCAPAAASAAAPGIVRLPAMIRTAACHLWLSANAAAATPTRRRPAGGGRAPRRRRGRCRPSRARRPVHCPGEQQARLQTRRSSPCDRRASTRPGGTRQPVDPARDVDGEHRRSADVGGAPGAVEAGAVRGVDHEIAVRQYGGTRGAGSPAPARHDRRAAGPRHDRRCRCCPCRPPR